MGGVPVEGLDGLGVVEAVLIWVEVVIGGRVVAEGECLRVGEGGRLRRGLGGTAGGDQNGEEGVDQT